MQLIRAVFVALHGDDFFHDAAFRRAFDVDDEIDGLGEVVRYRLAFSDRLPDGDRFGSILPLLNVWLK